MENISTFTLVDICAIRRVEHYNFHMARKKKSFRSRGLSTVVISDNKRDLHTYSDILPCAIIRECAAREAFFSIGGAGVELNWVEEIRSNPRRVMNWDSKKSSRCYGLQSRFLEFWVMRFIAWKWNFMITQQSALIGDYFFGVRFKICWPKMNQ